MSTLTDSPLPLPDDVLARRAALPLKPAPITLAGRYVCLLPLDLIQHTAPLYALTNGQPARLGTKSISAYDADALIWRWMFSGPFPTQADFAAYLEKLVKDPAGLGFCVIDVPTGHPIGSASLIANAPDHLKIEIGSVWYSPLAQGTAANTEATYLMLRHAFGLGYQRLEWKCNALNERSRRAALRMGFTFEGVQDAHYIIKGRRRDTAWFRILAEEWPSVQAGLEARLYGPHP